MGNQTYGYARVSTEQQNLDRQIDALTGYGVDRLYNEKMTGTRKDRPELRKMLESLTEGGYSGGGISLPTGKEYQRLIGADRAF